MNRKNDNNIVNFEFRIDQKRASHLHQSIELLFILEGEVDVTIGENTYHAVPDDIIVVNSNKRHGYIAKSDLLMAKFTIDTRQLQELLDTRQLLFWCNSVTNKNAAYDALRKVIRRILDRAFEKETGRMITLNGLYYQFLEVLTDNFLVRGDDKNADQSEEERVGEIVSYIENNYQNRLTLSELADRMYLSCPYLSKYIKKNLGMNFVDYVNSVRLYHAMDDLLGTTQPIIVIALENGFPNGAAFNDAFKKVYHVTPSEYRQNMRKTEASKEHEAENDISNEIRERVTLYFDSHSEIENEDSQDENAHASFSVKERREYSHFWNRMINVGCAPDLLRSDLQEQVLQMKKDLGFRYVRVWDVFGKDMLLNEGDPDGRYHFDRIDKILDFLVDHEIYPYLELGNKPKQLYRTLNDNIFKEIKDRPFADIGHYRKFLRAFAVHIVNRYGLEEVENWIFEQWSGEEFDEQTSQDEEFFDYFCVLYETMKRHSASIKVGGGGIGIQFRSGNLERLAENWTKQLYQPDFLSLYCYPYIRGDEDGVLYARQSTDHDFLKNQLAMAEEAIRKAGLSSMAIHVSEWSSTISNRSAINDSCYKGAYIIKNVLDIFEKVNVLGYWSASDIFAEHTDCSRLLFGGCGLMNAQGIKKPAYFAYYFLNQLGKYFVYKEKNAIVTTNGNNNYSIVCHNYRHLNYKYYMKKEYDLDARHLSDLFEDSSTLRMSFRMEDLPDGKYKIKVYSVSPESGSILNEWFQMGETDTFSRQEVDYLKRICTPHIRIYQGQAVNGILQFTTELAAQEIQYIHVSFQWD